MASELELDFRLLFQSAPGCCLVLTPDLTIVAVSDAYLRATMTARDAILGRALFDVFPDNPDDPSATGVANLRASLTHVLTEKQPHAMAVQKYDIRRPASEGGGFEERHWSPVNYPALSSDGRVAYIIHRVEDVTDVVRLKRKESEHNSALQELTVRSEERYRQLLDTAPDAMVVVANDGRIQLVNAQTEKLFGYARSELVGHDLEVVDSRALSAGARGQVTGLLCVPCGASHGCPARAVRPPQGRHRAPDRGEPQPPASGTRRDGLGGDPRHHRAKAAGGRGEADGRAPGERRREHPGRLCAVRRGRSPRSLQQRLSASHR